MHPSTGPLAHLFSYLSILHLVIATPVVAPQTSGFTLRSPPSPCQDDPTECNRPADASIYVCENTNWQPPCTLLHLDVVNNAIYTWGSAPSPWADGSWTVGSWGPAPGILTTIFSMDQVNKTLPTDPEYTYPGTADIGPFWRENVYSFVAGWDPNLDPSTLPQTKIAAPRPTAGFSGSKKVRSRDVDGGRPWWIQQAYF